MYQLIQENKPINPCISHARELLVDLYTQATNNPAGPWVAENQSEILIKFSCKLCGLLRLYKQITEKTTL